MKEEAIDIAGQQALSKLQEVGEQLLQKCRELQEEYSNPKTDSKQALETEIENLKVELQALREGKEKPADKPEPAKPDRTKEMVKAVTECARAAIIEVERTATDGTIAVTKEKKGHSKERFWVSEIRQEKSRIVKALEYIIDDMSKLRREHDTTQLHKKIMDNRKQRDEETRKIMDNWNQNCKERDERWAKQDEESREMIKWFEATAKRWTDIAEKATEKAVDK